MELTVMENEANMKIDACHSLDELEQIRIEYLGRKEGKLTHLLRGLGKLPAEERPEAGSRINSLKEIITTLLSDKQAAIISIQRGKKLLHEKIDVTMPGFVPEMGKRHPITHVLEEIINIFMSLGFEVEEGPEVEYSHYNFDALNIPQDHPARDMHDTFYISDSVVLRTHTSPVQIRVMKERKPPLRIIAPGRVYRRDADVSHSPMFHQVEGLLVDEKTTFGELKAVLEAFLVAMFGKDTPVRFRPSFFPFTEPSCEVDIGCVLCNQKGCGVCKQTGWLEVLGAGMVDPEVFKGVGYDPEKYVGFAFGLGVERLTMLKYGIDNIRLFFENDLRFLKQF
ncbi:phenylalanine--tRNA ligase subunit alpha [Candidatus Desantisbacteria bacterium]|nr:phenylalanine--tRNA ligase subunit alpha [Candidatus Desantisbacteria bacterium]